MPELLLEDDDAAKIRDETLDNWETLQLVTHEEALVGELLNMVGEGLTSHHIMTRHIPSIHPNFN
jgi:hypothetical protein